MAEFPKTSRNTITRLPGRGAYDEQTIFTILDEALFCTLAFVRENQPFQIPTGFCRIQDRIYIHGSVGSTYLRELAAKRNPVCISATILDGLVLARAAFHHSVNYRSVVLFGVPEKVTREEELYHALEVFTNKMQPGRWDDVRKPDPGEWKATLVLSVRIDEASAKVRSGPPKDDKEDYASDIWAGVVPLHMQRSSPQADPLLNAGIPIPEYLR